MRFLVCMLAVIASVIPFSSQDRERQGREILGRAAADARVTDAVPRLWLIEGAGRENLTGELQGLAADEPTWRPHEERVAVDYEQQSVAWERRTPRNDESLRHRRFAYSPTRTVIVDHANDVVRAIPGDVPAARRRALMRRIPHLLLADVVSRSAWRIAWVRAVTIDGRDADEVAVDLPGDGRLILAIGRAPAHLYRAAYDLHFPGRGDTTVTWHWTGWKADPILGSVPSGHRLEIDGMTFQEVTYTRFATGDESALALIDPRLRDGTMQGGAAQPWAAAAGPANGEVAPGVHVGRLSGFTFMFVEQEDGIVAFEAPEPFFGTESIPASGQDDVGSLTPQIIAHIKQTIPGKPITHVVISHHHGDHMGGIRAFAAEGAEIVIAARDAGAARAALARPHTILGETAPVNSTVRAVEGRMRIGSGQNAVEVIDIGLNPHTEANLVFWVPGPRVMIQGDLFYFTAGTGFHAGRERMNRFFAAWLHENGLAPRLLYGVHNQGAAGAAALAKMGTDPI